MEKKEIMQRASGDERIPCERGRYPASLAESSLVDGEHADRMVRSYLISYSTTTINEVCFIGEPVSAMTSAESGGDGAPDLRLCLG